MSLKHTIAKNLSAEEQAKVIGDLNALSGQRLDAETRFRVTRLESVLLEPLHDEEEPL